MPLSAGMRLGPYEIVAPLGAGGMGEVYRAKDTRLRRTVALKVLPSNLSDRERLMQRLTREAQAVSNLSHPHICTLYDIGMEDETLFLVMEHIDGENLATILAKRSLTLDEALRYGIQIADALAKAHEKGIIHRDLKPGNVMVTKTGVKLLDFGLAKFCESNSSSAVSPDSYLTTMEHLTVEGTISGTLPYMAPEQLEGKQVDFRVDIFALGAVLFEMITRKRAFEADSQANLIAKILTAEVPPVSAIEATASPQLNHLVSRCLSKNPEDRWQSASDVMHQLKWIAEHSSATSITSAATLPFKNRRSIPALFIVFAAIGMILLGVYYALSSHKSSETLASYSLSVMMPEEARIFMDHSEIALSPDAKHLVYVAQDQSGALYLWLRDLESLQTRKLDQTKHGTLPFWSPDNQWIGFFADETLKKLRISESQPQTICPSGAEPGGPGTWNREGIILFAPVFEGPLYKVSENGGIPEQVTKLNTSRGETNHAWPQFLPDQHHFLFQAMGKKGSDGVYVGELGSRDVKEIMPSDKRPVPVAMFVAPDQLVFAQDTALMVQRLDPQKFQLSGQPVRIAEGVSRLPWSQALFSVADKDVIAFRRNVMRVRTQLEWLDRKGVEIQKIGQPQSYETIALSPDNRRAAVDRWESSARHSIWLVDLLSGIETRVTFSTDDYSAIWSPDGQKLLFASARDTPPNLFLKNLDSDEKEERLFFSDEVNDPSSWSSDGRYILFSVRNSSTKSWDIWAMDLQGNQKKFPVLATEFDELNAQISPDGKWIAYESNESGRYEIYVRPFFRSGGKTLVSNQGGVGASWNKAGTELFYFDQSDRLMSVSVKAGGSFEASVPQPLFQANGVSGFLHVYGVSNDGNRFLLNMVTPQQPPSPPIDLLIHWTGLLK